MAHSNYFKWWVQGTSSGGNLQHNGRRRARLSRIMSASERPGRIALLFLKTVAPEPWPCLAPRGGRYVRRVRFSYGVRTVSRTVFGTVFGPCVARRTVRRSDLGFQIQFSIFDTRKTVAPAQSPKDSQGTAGQLVARGLSVAGTPQARLKLI
jgi:hypothetical protein